MNMIISSEGPGAQQQRRHTNKLHFLRQNASTVFVFSKFIFIYWKSLPA